MGILSTKNSDVRRHKRNGGVVVRQTVACYRQALAEGGVGGER